MMKKNHNSNYKRGVQKPLKKRGDTEKPYE